MAGNHALQLAILWTKEAAIGYTVLMNNLPTLSPGLLSSSNSTSAIFDALARLHNAKDYVALDAARAVMDSWAETLAINDAPQQAVELLNQRQEIPFAQVLGAMDQAQAQRFLAELFDDIIPHLSSQKALFEDLAKGRAQNGMSIDMPDGARLSHVLAAAMMGQKEGMLLDIQTQIQELTWVDDNLRSIQIDMELDVVTDGNKPSSNPRKLNF